MTALDREREKVQSVLVLLLLLVFSLYLATLFHDAFADDEVYLAYANRFLRESKWTELYQLLLGPTNPWEFLPLRDLTYWIDFRIYGDEPIGFHATNLVWYAACGLSCFWFFRELILLCRPGWSTRANFLALGGVLIFLAHPAHVEVAAWIASRKDLIAGTLSFLGLGLLVRSMRREWSSGGIAVAILILFLACFGKASAMANVLFASVLLASGWGLPLQSRRTKQISFLLFLWLVTLIAYVIHLKVGASTGIRIENHPGLWAVIERASRIFSSLVGILLLPHPLRFYYDVYQLGDWHWVLSGSGVVLLLVSLWVLSMRRALWALGSVLLLSSLVMYLQLVPFTTWSLASERFVFVSVAGFALVGIDLLGRIRRPRIIGGLVLVVAIPYAILTGLRIQDWGEAGALLPREYEFQPEFHNAIRDRIVYSLFAKKQYTEARLIARNVQRPYARTALLALIDAEEAYRNFSDLAQSPEEEGYSGVQQTFCQKVAGLRLAISDAYKQIPTEVDVSYNNILRTLDKKVKFHYADSRKICAESARS